MLFVFASRIVPLFLLLARVSVQQCNNPQIDNGAWTGGPPYTCGGLTISNKNCETSYTYTCMIGYNPNAFKSVKCRGKWNLWPVANEYSADIGSAACVQCEAGKFKNSFTSDACSSCLPGKYQDQTGQGSCVDCDPGSECPAGKGTLPLPCPIGKYQSSGDWNCVRCEIGYYGNATGLFTSKCSGLCVNGADCTSFSGPGAGAVIERGSLSPTSSSSPLVTGSSTSTVSSTSKESPSSEITSSAISTLSHSSTTSSTLSVSYSGTPSLSPSPSVSTSYSVTISSTPSPSFSISQSPSPSALSNRVGYHRPQFPGPEVKCPAGRYGETTQLVTSDCTKKCPKGYFCPEGTYDFRFFPCPKGFCE